MYFPCQICQESVWHNGFEFGQFGSDESFCRSHEHWKKLGQRKNKQQKQWSTKENIREIIFFSFLWGFPWFCVGKRKHIAPQRFFLSDLAKTRVVQLLTLSFSLLPHVFRHSYVSVHSSVRHMSEHCRSEQVRIIEQPPPSIPQQSDGGCRLRRSGCRANRNGGAAPRWGSGDWTDVWVSNREERSARWFISNFWMHLGTFCPTVK